MSTIRNIRLLKGAAVLAERTSKDTALDFLRYNLIYGFNGSGKSTLSRVFSCLEKGKQHPRLPNGISFELEMSDKERFICPEKLTGIESRICVFNGDFIDDNLQWAEGKANPIFYIGREQTESAERLKELEKKVPESKAKLDGDAKIAQAKDKSLLTHKRDRARTIAERLKQGNRRYEAPQLTQDYETETFDATSGLSAEALDAMTAVCSRTSPAGALNKLVFDCEEVNKISIAAREIAGKTPGGEMVADIAKYPAMVPWVKQGFDFHKSNNLLACLYCGNDISNDRQTALANALDDRLKQFIAAVDAASEAAETKEGEFSRELGRRPDSSLITPELAADYLVATKALEEAGDDILGVLVLCAQLLKDKQRSPTAILPDGLPVEEAVKEKCQSFTTAVEAINSIIGQHNEKVSDFDRYQNEARLAIRRHYLAEGLADYSQAMSEADEAAIEAARSKQAHESLAKQIDDLRSQIQTHGPAAEAISKLVRSYLGHGELSITAVKDGYELHRHGELVRGPPSEGEKTAIALCYFLSTLEAGSRKLKDLIVVIDDPISSLDTKAMNYACSLIRAHLEGAEQLFVLTHNQHCMNEFKKFWKGWADEKKDNQTAKLYFLDVKKSGDSARSSMLEPMPKQLRDNDSEYHFLIQKILQFEKDGLTSEYAFMMPNVIRRALDVFLAFRIPKPGNLRDKLAALIKANAKLDGARLMALERLSQVESHSDSLDDLIAHSSMTVEEAYDANSALLELMNEVDLSHINGLRGYCKAT